MMQSYFKKRPHIFFSVLFHGLLLLSLIVFAVMKSCYKEEPIHVFEMTDVSEKTTIAQEIKPVKQSTPIKKMDYSEFLKENPKVAKKPTEVTKENKKTSNQNISKINLDSLPKFEVKSSETSQSQVNDILKRNALEEYGVYIYKTISANWVEPKLKSSRVLELTVSFTVRGDGELANVQITKSSGNSVFDASIMKVFYLIKRFNQTPTGASEVFSMAFKIDK